MTEKETILRLQAAFLKENSDIETQAERNRLSDNNLRSLFVWAYKEYYKMKNQKLSEIEQLKTTLNIVNQQNQDNQPEENIINYYKEQVATLNNFWKLSIEKNSKQVQRINQISEQNRQLTNQMHENQNNFTLKLCDYQYQILEMESQKIEEDQQYQQEIRNLNNLRDQTIEQMKQVIKNAQQYQFENQPNQNFQQDENQNDKFQNIIDQINQVKAKIEQSENSLEVLIKQIEFQIEKNKNRDQNENNENSKIRQLLKILEKNRISFAVVRQVFEKIVQCFISFKLKNISLTKNNEKLNEQLIEYKKQQNKSNEEFNNLVKNLEKQLNQETKRIQELIRDRGIQIQYDDKQRNYLSDAYTKLYKDFLENIRQNIEKLANKSLELIPNENSKVQGNPQLIQYLKSFINNISNQNQIQDVDSMNQKWQASVNLFENIYKQLDQNSIMNQNIRQVILQISEILKDILKYKEKCEEEKNKLIQNIKQ